MKIYQYQNYDQYKKIQTETNIKKLSNVWVDKSTVLQIKQIIPDAKNILCHGVRNATELLYFKEIYPDSFVLGTEISTTASKFKNVIEWDFHDINTDWIKKFDIVYSNSWDHSYDPEKSLETWKNQLLDEGHLIVEHGYGEKENKSSASDPLEIYDNEIIQLLIKLNLQLKCTFETTALQKKTVSRVYVITKK
jgi:hypothetical protein